MFEKVVEKVVEKVMMHEGRLMQRLLVCREE